MIATPIGTSPASCRGQDDCHGRRERRQQPPELFRHEVSAGQGIRNDPRQPARWAGKEIQGRHVYASLAESARPMSTSSMSFAALRPRRGRARGDRPEGQARAQSDLDAARRAQRQGGGRGGGGASRGGDEPLLKIEYGRLSGEIGWAGVSTPARFFQAPPSWRARGAGPRHRREARRSRLSGPGGHQEAANGDRHASHTPSTSAAVRPGAVRCDERPPGSDARIGGPTPSRERATLSSTNMLRHSNDMASVAGPSRIAKDRVPGLCWCHAFSRASSARSSFGDRLAAHAKRLGPWSRYGSRQSSLHDALVRVGLQEIIAYTAPDNLRSRAVMERLGLERDPGHDFTADYDRVGSWHGLVWKARTT